MLLLETIRSKLYDEAFWLPENVTWKDLESTPDNRYPRGSDLLIPLAIAPLLLLFRILYEKLIATRIALFFGIPALKTPSPVPCLHPELERFYRANRKPSSGDIAAIAKRIDISEAKIVKWFRIKNRSVRPQLLTKFNESFWKFSYYLAAFAYGCYVLADEPWALETRQWWIDFPRHPLNGDVFVYYIGVLGFYWSLVLSHFFDVQRKDSMQMFVHHLVTISLMSFSWFNNFVRVGCFIVVLHDAVDFWLEGAKMARYCSSRLCDLLFVVFMSVWFVTRLVIFPLYPLYSVAFECREILAPFHSWYVFLTLLCILQVLHVFWFFLIMRVAIGALTSGEVEKDSRSDSEGESTMDETLNLDTEEDKDEDEEEKEEDESSSDSDRKEVNANIIKSNGDVFLHKGDGDFNRAS